MNDRIRELAKNAGFGLHQNGEIYTSRLEHLPITEDIEKLVELIVIECMNCADWVGKVNTTPVEPINTAHAIKKRIKQHFEVDK